MFFVLLLSRHHHGDGFSYRCGDPIYNERTFACNLLSSNLLAKAFEKVDLSDLRHRK